MVLLVDGRTKTASRAARVTRKLAAQQRIFMASKTEKAKQLNMEKKKKKKKKKSAVALKRSSRYQQATRTRRASITQK